MLKNILKTYARGVSLKTRQFSCQSSKVEVIDEKPIKVNNCEILDTRLIQEDQNISYSSPENTVLEKCEEDISHIAPYLKPSFNFAAYVNKSETLQELVKLGVQLYKFEKEADLPPYILQLNFEKDIKQHVIFLSDLGLENDHLGDFITKNPLIFKEDLVNLEARINYLKFKKFNNEMILRIIQENPKWLSFSTQEIDKKLGFFQKYFSLTGNEVRQLVTKKPNLITFDMEKIKLNSFVIKEEMGFTPEEAKQILLHTPKLFMKSIITQNLKTHINNCVSDQHNTLKTFEYIHNKMKISLETIAKMPKVLTCREFRIKQRHLFLEKLNKIQFDPKKPNYISLMSLISGSDSHFATEIAGSSIHTFNTFLKSI